MKRKQIYFWNGVYYMALASEEAAGILQGIGWGVKRFSLEEYPSIQFIAFTEDEEVGNSNHRLIPVEENPNLPESFHTAPIWQPEKPKD